MLLLLMAATLVSLTASAAASDSLLSPKGVNYEVAALMSMKSKMIAEYENAHVLDGWDIYSVDPCTWNMVACSAQGFVISLDMASVGFSGLLSPSIGNLTHLRSLLMQNNHLSGPIPEEIGKLKELQTLDLSGNQFNGHIPESIGSLSRLNYLRLSKNELSGQIPVPVADLTGLSFLDLSFNNLSGPTPKIQAKSYSITGNSFLCTSSSAQICMSKENTLNETNSSGKASDGREWVIPVAAGVSCVFVVSVLLILGWVQCYRSRLILSKSNVQQEYEFDMGQLRRFTFRELQIATGNFAGKNILGQGGFGVVYKGCLPNKTMVAVKRLRDPNLAGEVQFQTEVEMIGLALHRNLLRLYGFCMTPEERMLVYPYMPNGSVADRLRDPIPSLDWKKRMSIAVGAARGLLYLHEQCNPKIIHRDVKAANILLDTGYEAVVGDFGLAKLLDRRESHVTTAVRGTAGHIAPEYLSTGQSSDKTDVFGFGILLLELITGQKPPLGAPKGMILDSVKRLYEEKKVEMVADTDLRGCFEPEELERVVELALLCTQANPALRPNMSQVLKLLEAVAINIDHHEVLQELDHPHPHPRTTASFSSDVHHHHDHHYSFTFEPMELSGPR